MDRCSGSGVVYICPDKIKGCTVNGIQPLSDIYTGADGVNYRKTPDYNAPAVGVVKYGQLFTVVGESGDFYELKAGWYLTKRKDLVELIETA